MALAALMLGSATVLAGPIQKSQVSAAAKWVIHLDMDQFSPSRTCRLLTSSGQPGARNFQSLLNHYRTLLGLDPLKDLSSITIYGNETTGNHGVALISGNLNGRTITKQLSAYPQYRTKTSGKLLLHTWQDKSTGRPLWAVFHTQRQMILASDEASLLAADSTLDGNSPSLARGKAPLLPIPAGRKGTFFTAVTHGYAGTNPDPIKALILKNTVLATCLIAEQSDVVDGSLVLEAVSEDAATVIHQTLNGLMVASTFTDDTSPLAKLATIGEITQDGKLVVLKIHCPASDAAGLLAAALLNQ